MTERIDVLVTEDISGAPLDDLATRHRVVLRPEAWRDRGALRELVSRARAIVVRNRTMVDAELLAAAPDLRIVARAGVGLDNIDLAAARERGVVVSAPLGANAVSVAEHTLGLALALARRTVALDAGCRSGEWDRSPGTELHGGTWGLLGAGATGRACGRLAAALGMRVLAFDPYLEPDDPELTGAGIELVPLADAVTRSDVISIHLPATGRTRGLVDAALLARMRPTALLINVGRGEVIDENALADALESGAPAGAALDVRAQEPPRPSRLDKLDNVLFTPHIAGITVQSQERILRLLSADVDAVLSGGRPASAVDTRGAGRR
ncbi:MAG TPA: hydroxyacid dehydrogenase [Streptosporangiaceae bacterium]|jgi:phosphoglycerate dehydrogenase-like enzyme|nr:hydroxyacid dehydrogenase [Streptosporangiaceae bacterium]